MKEFLAVCQSIAASLLVGIGFVLTRRSYAIRMSEEHKRVEWMFGTVFSIFGFLCTIGATAVLSALQISLLSNVTLLTVWYLSPPFCGCTPPTVRLKRATIVSCVISLLMVAATSTWTRVPITQSQLTGSARATFLCIFIHLVFGVTIYRWPRLESFIILLASLSACSGIVVADMMLTSFAPLAIVFVVILSGACLVLFQLCVSLHSLVRAIVLFYPTQQAITFFLSLVVAVDIAALSAFNLVASSILLLSLGFAMHVQYQEIGSSKD